MRAMAFLMFSLSSVSQRNKDVQEHPAHDSASPVLTSLSWRHSLISGNLPTFSKSHEARRVTKCLIIVYVDL